MAEDIMLAWETSVEGSTLRRKFDDDEDADDDEDEDEGEAIE